MSLEQSALRQAFATRIALLSGWWQAPVPWDSFAPSGVPDGVPMQKAHLAFVVGIGDSDPGERQKTSEGTDTETEIRIAFYARHTPGPTSSQTSEDAALDARAALVKQIMASWSSTFQVQRLLRLPASELIRTGEFFLLRAHFTARHRLPLQ